MNKKKMLLILTSTCLVGSTCLPAFATDTPTNNSPDTGVVDVAPAKINAQISNTGIPFFTNNKIGFSLVASNPQNTSITKPFSIDGGRGSFIDSVNSTITGNSWNVEELSDVPAKVKYLLDLESIPSNANNIQLGEGENTVSLPVETPTIIFSKGFEQNDNFILGEKVSFIYRVDSKNSVLRIKPEFSEQLENMTVTYMDATNQKQTHVLENNSSSFIDNVNGIVEFNISGNIKKDTNIHSVPISFKLNVNNAIHEQNETTDNTSQTQYIDDTRVAVRLVESSKIAIAPNNVGTYKLVVTNTGSKTARNLNLIDLSSPNLKLVIDEEYKNFDLLAGESKTITVKGIVQENQDLSKGINFRTGLSSPVLEKITTENCQTNTSRCVELIQKENSKLNLKIASTTKSTILAGTVKYLLTLTNIGKDDASMVEVNLGNITNLENIKFSENTNYGINAEGNTLVIPTLKAGKTITLSFSGQIKPTAAAPGKAIVRAWVANPTNILPKDFDTNKDLEGNIISDQESPNTTDDNNTEGNDNNVDVPERVVKNINECTNTGRSFCDSIQVDIQKPDDTSTSSASRILELAKTLVNTGTSNPALMLVISFILGLAGVGVRKMAPKHTPKHK